MAILGRSYTRRRVNNPAVLVSSSNVTANAGLATATAAAYNPTVTITADPPVATATAAALTPTATVNAKPPVATATATADQPTVAITAFPPVATATATAEQPTADITVFPTLATATAAAYEPTVLTGTVGNAGLATATAAADQPTVSITAFPTLATATAAADQPTAGLTALPPAATATAAADQPTADVNADPGAATATAAAYTPSVSITGGNVTANPTVAQATATAYQPTVTTEAATHIFTPPCVNDGSPQAWWDRKYDSGKDMIVNEWSVPDANPAGFKLMRYYRQRPVGVAVFKMSDGTYRLDRPVPGITGLINAPPYPPSPASIQNGPVNVSWLYSVINSEEVQNPAVEIVYYGGTSYEVSATEAADLAAAGLGAYVT